MELVMCIHPFIPQTLIVSLLAIPQDTGQIRETRSSKMYSVNGRLDNSINSYNKVKDGKNRELCVKRVRVSIPASGGKSRGIDI